MYRIVICEDDITQMVFLRECILKSLEGVSSQIELLEFNSGEELLESALEGVDIYFLDIQMLQLTGMDVAKIIRETNDTSEIIFITSIVDYIQEGYKVRAYRYLLKPIDFEDLNENILNCISDIIKKRENFMLIENKGIINKILINSIMYIEVRKKVLTIHTTDGIYNTNNSMDKIELELEKYNFFRCHKSYLINMEYIQLICKNTVVINNENIPVSKYRISDLKTKLTHVLGDVLC
ncbi:MULTISPECIES: LytR/AlgR family response regulator transcription factor [unclassified Clostridioides]|uniref:LytR/AlgR family response regulator transcription factor n=1 Tax=unclassified Clostridioides TaxID=2635829 RepID=UPI001D0CD815|nr:response regulator transcription factor [Clostridioides sp. ES-S-0001-02]MCC0640936.1 response regulator transcription factor [Clostridioides sp. ES-S-0049-03]MCC0653459.1 response regulator transcription factor [Clostridioides sp. ES-S-0001-03]MCC0656523.1 response regulator transcription factor [Clostridioides sp. ES-S-0123-01]MCC0675893.1 response regulator transcription factor [Clostridioides sp. ES-W-0018-02]MCC0681229.1 response regulator transcription factor [Clostridioides sp. ES-S-